MVSALGFSPASRIILIESGAAILGSQLPDIDTFQSRKQDYFNWKANLKASILGQLLVSVPQAGLF